MPRYTSGTDLPKSGLELQKRLFLVIAHFEAEHGSCTGGSRNLYDWLPCINFQLSVYALCWLLLIRAYIQQSKRESNSMRYTFPFLFHFHSHFSDKVEASYWPMVMMQQNIIVFCVSLLFSLFWHFSHVFWKVFICQLLLILQQNIYPTEGGGNLILCDTLLHFHFNFFLDILF